MIAIKYRILAIFFVTVLLSCDKACALATPHHIYNISRRLVETIGSPFYGIFVIGPRNVKNAYHAEVWEREKPEKRGRTLFKIVGVLRAPGEEGKGVVDGVTGIFSSAGSACKEFISIFFGD